MRRSAAIGLVVRHLAHPRREVVVHAEEVQRRGRHLQVAVAQEREVARRRPDLPRLRRVAAGQHRVGEQQVRQHQRPRRGGPVLRLVGERGDRLQVQRDAVRRLGVRLPHRADGEAVTEQQVVRRGQRGAGVLHPGGVPAGAVAQHRRAVRLVQGDPAPHPVAEVLLDGRRELGEPVRGVAVRPAARVLERLRQVPVVERHDGRDAPPEQLVDQPRVEVDTRPGSRDRGRRAGSGATRPTAGRRRRRGPPSARRPRGSGGSGRRPRRRCHRGRSCPGCG